MIPHISFTEILGFGWAIFIAGMYAGAYAHHRFLKWKKARKA